MGNLPSRIRNARRSDGSGGVPKSGLAVPARCRYWISRNSQGNRQDALTCPQAEINGLSLLSHRIQTPPKKSHRQTMAALDEPHGLQASWSTSLERGCSGGVASRKRLKAPRQGGLSITKAVGFQGSDLKRLWRTEDHELVGVPKLKDRAGFQYYD